MFVVEVTYGTRPMMPFATVAKREWAEALKTFAVSKGYRDAQIVTEKEFRQKLTAKRRGS